MKPCKKKVYILRQLCKFRIFSSVEVFFFRRRFFCDASFGRMFESKSQTNGWWCYDHIFPESIERHTKTELSEKEKKTLPMRDKMWHSAISVLHNTLSDDACKRIKGQAKKNYSKFAAKTSKRTSTLDDGIFGKTHRFRFILSRISRNNNKSKRK